MGFVGDAGQEALETFLEQMPERYLLAYPVDVIRRHARIARDRGDAPLAVRLGPGPGGLAELVVVTEDRPGLLAHVAAVLTTHRLAIVRAEIYTRPRGEGQEAFDVFVVRREGSSPEVPPSVVARLETDLAAIFAGEETAQSVLARRAETPAWAVRATPTSPTEVRVDNGASSRFTVVDVVTKDRPGVLHLIAETLHRAGLTIAVSKVNTEGARVADVFYVSEPGGGKIRERARAAELERELTERLTAFHQEHEA